jgi:hypothetical protein
LVAACSVLDPGSAAPKKSSDAIKRGIFIGIRRDLYCRVLKKNNGIPDRPGPQREHPPKSKRQRGVIRLPFANRLSMSCDPEQGNSFQKTAVPAGADPAVYLFDIIWIF